MASTVLADTPRPELSLESRVVDAALRCIGRWGVAKTSLDDVAREAGCSRASIYRAFPGGKESVLGAVTRSELGRFFNRVAARLEQASTLEDLLVAGLSESYTALSSHQALQFLLAHEPELVLPNLTFNRLELVLAAASGFAAPYLAPYVGEEEARPAAEWVARLVLSYTLCPSEAFDLADEPDTRRLVRTFLLPGLRQPAPQAPA
jgi:AcrR family transcriptional regulator